MARQGAPTGAPGGRKRVFGTVSATAAALPTRPAAERHEIADHAPGEQQDRRYGNVHEDHRGHFCPHSPSLLASLRPLHIGELLPQATPTGCWKPEEKTPLSYPSVIFTASMTTFSDGRPERLPMASIAATTSNPFTTLPNRE